MSRCDLLYGLQVAIERVRSIAAREEDPKRLDYYRSAVRELAKARRELKQECEGQRA